MLNGLSDGGIQRLERGTVEISTRHTLHHALMFSTQLFTLESSEWHVIGCALTALSRQVLE
jgi:hypothetical protein